MAEGLEEHKSEQSETRKLPKLPILVGAAFIALIVILIAPRLEVYGRKGIHFGISHDAKQIELEDTLRKTWAQIAIAGFGIFILYFTWQRAEAGEKTVRIGQETLRVSQENLRLAEQGHITERFTKAIEQLGKMDGDKPNIEVRLGAIYALERIAVDSPRDHWTIMEILTAYVRQNAPAAQVSGREYGEKPRTDIQGVLTVIGRRHAENDLDKQRIDLSKCSLRGADLRNAKLEGASFYRTNLWRADLRRADLRMASMIFADLGEVSAEEANLQQALMLNADLRSASLSRANLQSAYMTESQLTGANLQMANLREANLQRANLQAAELYSADLRRSNLQESNLQMAVLNEANLQGASLCLADLKGAFTNGADFKDANFRNAKGLVDEQVMAARNWQEARYSTAFRERLGLPPEPGLRADGQMPDV